MTRRKRGARYWVSWSAVCAVALVLLAADAILQACEHRKAMRQLTRVNDDSDLYFRKAGL